MTTATLPIITSGSKKQIAWAQKIRAEVLEIIDDAIANCRRLEQEFGPETRLGVEYAVKVEMYQEALAVIVPVADAQTWIDKLRGYRLTKQPGFLAEVARRTDARMAG